jgi:hypothetical protein
MCGLSSQGLHLCAITHLTIFIHTYIHPQTCIAVYIHPSTHPSTHKSILGTSMPALINACTHAERQSANQTAVTQLTAVATQHYGASCYNARKTHHSNSPNAKTSTANPASTLPCLACTQRICVSLHPHLMYACTSTNISAVSQKPPH